MIKSTLFLNVLFKNGVSARGVRHFWNSPNYDNCRNSCYFSKHLARSITFTQAAGKLVIRDANAMFELYIYDNTESARQNLVLAVDDSPIAAVRN